VVQLESQLTFDVKKDSSLPLGMTFRGSVIPSPSTNALGINSVRDLGQTEPLLAYLNRPGFAGDVVEALGNN
jgi:hypothetical protein